MPRGFYSSYRSTYALGALLVLSLAISWLQPSASAARPAPAPALASNAWSPLGFQVGIVDALAIAPSNPSTLYAGVASDGAGYGETGYSGVYKSTDHGGSWSRAGLAGKFIYTLAVDPANANIVYAGTYRSGVYKTTDGGLNWTAISTGIQNGSTSDVVLILIDPAQTSTLYASVAGWGLYKSLDGGASWTSFNTGIQYYTLTGLVIDPTATNTLYAAAPGGVYKTTNGGTSWAFFSAGLFNVRLTSLALDPSNPTILYAGSETGVYKSTNSGASWSPSSSGLPTTNLISSLVVLPRNPSIILAATYGKGVYKSVDGGATWNSTDLTDNYVSRFAVDSSNQNTTVYAGIKGHGIFKSVDAGSKWQQTSVGLPNSNVKQLAIDPVSPGTLYAGTTDGLYKSVDGGALWKTTGLTGIDRFNLRPTMGLAIDPSTPSTVYASLDYFGLYKSLDGGKNWTLILDARNTNTYALGMDPRNPNTLYQAFFANHVYKTVDGGANWNQLNTPLYVYAIAVDPTTSTTVYAGSEFGLYKSLNGGTSWSATALRTPISTALVIDPANPSVIYVGTTGQTAYKSTDGGQSWNPIFVEAQGDVLALAIDPNNHNVIYAGTTAGCYKSTDGGQTSQPFNNGLPSTAKPVSALAIDLKGEALYAGTGVGVFAIQLGQSSTPAASLSISDASVAETNAGTTDAAFTVSLSAASTQAVTVDYATANNTAVSGGDYAGASGTLTFNPGETSKTVAVSVIGDTINEPDETFYVNLLNATNATISDAQALGTIINDDPAAPALPVLQFGQASYAANESTGFLNVTVTRAGNLSAPALIKYATSDTTDANFRCDPTTPGQTTGIASRKCDYHIAVGTLRFAAGEATRQFTLSLVNDIYVEGPETFTLTLSNPVGVTLGQNSTAAVTITDDDAPGAANPIDRTSFYVRQLYVDLLSREPDPAGWQGWTTRIDQCGLPGQPPPPCDRVTVGGDGFLRSGEFFDRQFFVLRLYRTGLGRILRYDEIADLAYVSGFLTDAQLELNKQDLVAEIVARQEFSARYNPLSNAAYVATLLQTAGVSVPQSAQDSWIAALDANTKSRAQVLREISERDEVSSKYLHEAQVVSAYYGFFTRNPDGAYLNYLQRLDSGEINLSDLANAFINAQEYRQRFGQ